MDTGAASTAGWGGDPFFFTEAARGGPFAWHVGDPGLEGDALGPVRHAHDDAAEYYFMYSGSAQVEVGGQELILEAGQLAYIPPDAPHNFLGPAADRDACLFCLVSPNLADNKWRVRDFRPGSESLRMEVARPFDDRDLPGDDRLTARGLTLAAGDQAVSLNAAGFEVVYLVIEGVAQVQLANGLGGGISAGTYLHLPEGLAHDLHGEADAKVLRMDCAFEAWKGVPTAADAADAGSVDQS